MSQERIEELRLKITDGVPTVLELREYCYLNFPPRMGMELIPAAEFITDDAIEAFNWLSNWWTMPTYPPALPKPNLLSFLWAIYVRPNEPKQRITDKFLEFYNRGRQYCIENGMNPDQPFEDPEETRKRKNRERMAAARAARKVPDKELRNPKLRELVRELEAEIESIKVRAKVDDETCRDAILMHQQQMIEAAARRKQVAQEHKDRIATLRADIKKLTAT